MLADPRHYVRIPCPDLRSYASGRTLPTEPAAARAGGRPRSGRPAIVLARSPFLLLRPGFVEKHRAGD
jgi:hypothetical protein